MKMITYDITELIKLHNKSSNGKERALLKQKIQRRCPERLIECIPKIKQITYNDITKLIQQHNRSKNNIVRIRLKQKIKVRCPERLNECKIRLGTFKKKP